MKYLVEGNSQKEEKPTDLYYLCFQSMAATVVIFTLLYNFVQKPQVLPTVCDLEMKQTIEQVSVTSGIHTSYLLKHQLCHQHSIQTNLVLAWILGTT